MEPDLKATSVGPLHAAVLNMHGVVRTTPSVGRVDPLELVKHVKFWVYRCIGINAQAAASVGYKLFTIAGSTASRAYGKEVPATTKAFLHGRAEVRPGRAARRKMHGRVDDLREIDDHPILDLLDDVNQWSDGFQFREGIFSDLQTFGRAFIHQLGEPQPVELWRMLPHLTKVVPHTTRFVDRFEYGRGIDKESFRPDEVIWFRLFDPEDPWGGLGPLEAWLKTIETSEAITEFWDTLMRRGGAPDYIATNKHGWNRQQRDDFRTDFKRMFSRLFRRRSNIALLSGEVELHKLSQTNKELEFIESAQMVRDMIGQAFGVPKSILTTDDVNRANGRESKVQHYEQLWSMLQRVEDVLNEQLVQQWSDRLVLVHDNPIPPDREIRIQERLMRLQSGSTINQENHEDGLEDVGPDGDVPLVGSGLTTLERVINPPEPTLGFGGGFGGPSQGRQAPQEAGEDSKVISQAKMWSAPQAKATGPEERLRQLVASVLGEQIRLAAEAADKGGVVRALEILGDIDWLERVTEALRSGLTPSLRAGVEQGGVGMGVDFDVSNPAVQEFIDQYTIRLASQIAGTTQLAASNVINQTLQEGGGVHDIAVRLRELDTQVTGYRAEMIARTETARAFMAGQQESWRQSGVVTGKKWLLAPNACQFCQALAKEYADKVIPLDQPFYPLGAVLRGVRGGLLRLDYEPILAPPLHPHDHCDLLPVMENG